MVDTDMPDAPDLVEDSDASMLDVEMAGLDVDIDMVDAVSAFSLLVSLPSLSVPMATADLVPPFFFHHSPTSRSFARASRSQRSLLLLFTSLLCRPLLQTQPWSGSRSSHFSACLSLWLLTLSWHLSQLLCLPLLTTQPPWVFNRAESPGRQCQLLSP